MALFKIDKGLSIEGDFSLLKGNGSPEGVVVAPKGSFYADVDSARYYSKATGDDDNGWILFTGSGGSTVIGHLEEADASAPITLSTITGGVAGDLRVMTYEIVIQDFDVPSRKRVSTVKIAVNVGSYPLVEYGILPSSPEIPAEFSVVESGADLLVNVQLSDVTTVNIDFYRVDSNISNGIFTP